MRPPVTKRLNTQPTLPTSDLGTEALEEKKKLAHHLHNQGVNPERWTEAHPALQAEQQTYRSTGFKRRDNQFEVGGKLYDWSPAVMATPQQAKAIADAYVAERSGKDPNTAPTPKIEDLVDVAKVPLKHPFGTPHLPRPADDMSVAEERTALIRHYAQSGVDPAKAHLGDPAQMKDQARLKAQIEKTLPGDRSEISGLPAFYQGFDDGWIYKTNDHTRAGSDPETNRTESAAANENGSNDGAAVDKIVKDYDADQDKDRGLGSNNAASKYAAAAQNMPEIISVLETLQAGKTLTERQQKIKARIEGSLEKAGVKFDYTLSNPDELRSIYEQAKTELSGMQGGKSGPSDLAMAMLTMQATEAIAGGSFDTVRMMQSESLAETLLLGAQKYLPIARKAIKPLITAGNVERANEGPIDYEAAFSEMRGLFSDIGLMDDQNTDDALPGVAGLEGLQRQRELKPASSETVQRLNSGLADASNVEIVIGGVPLFKQSEHKTLMDEIFRTEFIKIAQEKGCLPGPEGEQWDSHGGTKAQKRITDVDQNGHLGSRQPDGWVKWQNPDESWTEVLWNSTSTLADGFTNIAREAAALKDTLIKAGKQWAMRNNMAALQRLTRDPVLSEPSIVSMGEKPAWSEAELRDYISKKLRDFFDKNFKDCKFIGEDREQKLDDPDDPDLPATPPR